MASPRFSSFEFSNVRINKREPNNFDKHEIILDSNLFEVLLTLTEPPSPTEESSTITKNHMQNNTETSARSVQQTR